jgi:hypothetical protein
MPRCNWDGDDKLGPASGEGGLAAGTMAGMGATSAAVLLIRVVLRGNLVAFNYICVVEDAGSGDVVPRQKRPSS